MLIYYKIFFKPKNFKLTCLPLPDHPSLGILVHYIILSLHKCVCKMQKNATHLYAPLKIKITQYVILLLKDSEIIIYKIII
jgi:hypothetical protein